MERAWWSGSSETLAAALPSEVLGRLAAAGPHDVVNAQIGAWQVAIAQLQHLASALPGAWLFLEFVIPRMGRRADAVIVYRGHVFVVEYKVGESGFPRHAREQAHGYALDLANFHETSQGVPLVPLLVATEAPAQNLPLMPARTGVSLPVCLSPADLLPAILQLSRGVAPPLDALAWAAGAYRPTPTIIEAAQALFRGHRVHEIARAGAANLEETRTRIDQLIEATQAGRHKTLIFLTGVPGAGKTLAGLGIACARMNARAAAPTAYLSGNGPLVAVLQKALALDARRRAARPEPGDPPLGYSLRRRPDAFIQNVHKFRDDHVRDHRAPPEQVVVFDEAQRAWTAEETARFMGKRGHAGWHQSEPAFLLSVMDRHPDWCAVICLVGEGQEINRGEAGIGAWIEALGNPGLSGWQVHAPPHLLSRTAGLPAQTRAYLAHRAGPGDSALHLAVSVRSFKASQVSEFVASLLADDAALARSRLPDPATYPIVRTRSLEAARAWLRARRGGGERAGIVASSNALRLKPHGLFVKAKVDGPTWFLNPPEDIRSSDMLEDVASEFDVQGLELDWACCAWDLNLMRSTRGWTAREFRGTRWQPRALAGLTDQRRAYVLNSYRVLLTRARQGLVIFVPPGDAADATRPPGAYDAVDAWLAECGIPPVSA